MKYFKHENKNFESFVDVSNSKEMNLILNDVEGEESRCQYCFESCDNLKKCSQCKNAFYCSKECQKEDWKEHQPIYFEIQSLKMKTP
jgi:hypothetical protein